MPEEKSEKEMWCVEILTSELIWSPLISHIHLTEQGAEEDKTRLIQEDFYPDTLRVRKWIPFL